MNLDHIQKTWNEQDAATIYTIDAEALHENIKRKSRKFDAIVTIRDMSEIIAPICLLLILVYNGVVTLPEKVGGAWYDYWYLYLFSIPILFTAGYYFRGRRQEKQKIAHYDDTILGEVEKAIYKIDRQVRVSRNLLWWDIIPNLAGIFPLIYFLSLLKFKSGDPVLQVNPWFLFTLITLLTLLALWVYKYIVQNKLKPRKKEYEAFRDKLLSEL